MAVLHKRYASDELMFHLATIDVEDPIEQAYWLLAEQIFANGPTDGHRFSWTSALRKLIESKEAYVRHRDFSKAKRMVEHPFVGDDVNCETCGEGRMHYIHVTDTDEDHPVTPHVIILAQGDQKRLGDTGGLPKRLLRLPLHSEAGIGDVTILDRTLVQVTSIWPGCHITIVAAQAIINHVKAVVRNGGHAGPMHGFRGHYTSVFQGAIQVVTLQKPGNSSLRGLEQVLSIRRAAQISTLWKLAGWPQQHDQTVVLLGDVLYSWRCLREVATMPHGTLAPLRFVTTSNLSKSGGELWGISWDAESDLRAFEVLLASTKKHPPFEGTYQPGQLRRMLWEAEGSDLVSVSRFYCDDYTMDVNLPEHIPQLANNSILAFDDDRAEGLYAR